MKIFRGYEIEMHDIIRWVGSPDHNSLVTYLLKLLWQIVSQQVHIVRSSSDKNELSSSFKTYLNNLQAEWTILHELIL